MLLICDAPSIEEVHEILRLASRGAIHESAVRLHQVYEQGYSIYDLVNTLYKVLLTMEDEVGKEKLFEMIKSVAELKKRVLEGLTSEIQLGQFLAKCAAL